MRIIPRSEWGARPARSSSRVARSRRRAFVVHYDGTHPITRTGSAIPKAIQDFHMDGNGWRDGGYSFVISQAGDIYQMRGWDEVGAHAGSKGNTEGIGVQVAIGGNQEPSQEALRALAWLKGEADRLMGRTLSWRQHGDYMSTSCAGGPLRRWLAAGRPLSDSTPPQTDSGWDGKPIRGGTVTTPYGARGRHWSTDRDRNGEGIHTGDDWNRVDADGRIITKVGDPVFAVADGTVLVYDGGDLGLMSVLRGDNGRFYRYCHLKRGSRTAHGGARVRAGDQIAEVGLTGKTTGPHLHLEDTSSSQIWPPQGHRKPSWPLPATPSAPEEEPMPTLVEHHFTIDHPGGRWAASPDHPAIGTDVIGPIHWGAEAEITAPAGAKLRTRWAVLNRRTGEWTHRTAPEQHAGHEAKAVITNRHTGGDAEVSVFLDVECDIPGPVRVAQHSHFRRK